jgi:hypothetical protein
MNPSGRFLKEENNGWVEIGDERACKKAGQAIRENNKTDSPPQVDLQPLYEVPRPILPVSMPRDLTNQMDIYGFQQMAAFPRTSNPDHIQSQVSTHHGMMECDNLGRSSMYIENSNVRALAQKPIHDYTDYSLKQHGNESMYQRPRIEDSRSFNTSFNNSFTSTSSNDSDRRKLFRKMKHEESCLPISLPETDTPGPFNENDLMKESLVSVDMQPVEIRKSTNVSTNDTKMDFVDELMFDALDSDAEQVSGGSLASSSSSGNKPKSNTNISAMPFLPQVMEDISHQTQFSDQSRRSATMYSDVSQTISTLDLHEHQSYRQR